jgi:hypothetical protein
LTWTVLSITIMLVCVEPKTLDATKSALLSICLLIGALGIVANSEKYLRRREWSRWAQTFRETTSEERRKRRAKQGVVFVVMRHFRELRFWFGMNN